MTTRPPLRVGVSTASSFGTPSASSSRNPLHLKVQRLLSANLEDAGTRAALDTLGEFDSALSDDQPRRAGSSGSGNAAIGVALRRGGLRKEVEGRMAEGSREFLEAFSEVNDVSCESSGRGYCELISWVGAETELAPVASRRDAPVL